MADWVVYDTGAAVETLPPSLATAYAAWLTVELRAQRLGLIASGVVQDFRKSVAADSDANGKLDEDSVPMACLRHVTAVAWYTLAQEMGADPEPYRSAWQDSEIYLRRLYQDLKAGGTVSGATGTPRYAPGSASGGGSSAVADGDLLYVPGGGDVAGGINASPPALMV
jgi:hypothetical protein